ncbi:MAG: hypothetical protein LBC70_08250 [Chitinispirillales bacterium]|jgi:hypothetical protein|nr:hypothetical protein [Chitinispirillales bacterium]
MKKQFYRSALRTFFAAFTASSLAVILAIGCSNNSTGPGGGGSIVLDEGYAWVGDVSIEVFAMLGWMGDADIGMLDVEDVPGMEDISVTVRVACIPRTGGDVSATVSVFGVWSPMEVMGSWKEGSNNTLLLTDVDGDTLTVTYRFSNSNNTLTVTHSEFGTAVLQKTAWPTSDYKPGDISDLFGETDPELYDMWMAADIFTGTVTMWMFMPGDDETPAIATSIVTTMDGGGTPQIQVYVWSTSGSTITLIDIGGTATTHTYSVSDGLLTMDGVIYMSVGGLDLLKPRADSQIKLSPVQKLTKRALIK